MWTMKISPAVVINHCMSQWHLTIYQLKTATKYICLISWNSMLRTVCDSLMCEGSFKTLFFWHIRNCSEIQILQNNLPQFQNSDRDQMSAQLCHYDVWLYNITMH